MADPVTTTETPPQTSTAETPAEKPEGTLLTEEKKEEEGSLLGTAKAEEGEVKTEEAPKAEAAPEPITYKDFAVPEGVTLVPEALEPFKALAAEHRLPQESAQKLLDFHIAEVKKIADANMADWKKVQGDWRKQTETDPDVGGNNLGSTKSLVAKALDQFGAPGIREALDITGAGNHPAVVKTLAKMAKALVEGGPGPTGEPPARRKSPIENFYGPQSG